jgi:hypothetical protein
MVDLRISKFSKAKARTGKVKLRKGMARRGNSFRRIVMERQGHETQGSGKAEHSYAERCDV